MIISIPFSASTRASIGRAAATYEITQAGYVSSNSSDFTFTLIKQSDGSYRIMDNKGLYVGISGGKIANLTNIILWTEASDDSQTYIFEKIG